MQTEHCTELQITQSASIKTLADSWILVSNHFILILANAGSDKLREILATDRHLVKGTMGSDFLILTITAPHVPHFCLVGNATVESGLGFQSSPVADARVQVHDRQAARCRVPPAPVLGTASEVIHVGVCSTLVGTRSWDQPSAPSALRGHLWSPVALKVQRGRWVLFNHIVAYSVLLHQ